MKRIASTKSIYSSKNSNPKTSYSKLINLANQPNIKTNQNYNPSITILPA